MWIMVDGVRQPLHVSMPWKAGESLLLEEIMEDIVKIGCLNALESGRVIVTQGTRERFRK